MFDRRQSKLVLSYMIWSIPGNYVGIVLVHPFGLHMHFNNYDFGLKHSILLMTSNEICHTEIWHSAICPFVYLVCVILMVKSFPLGSKVRKSNHEYWVLDYLLQMSVTIHWKEERLAKEEKMQARKTHHHNLQARLQQRLIKLIPPTMLEGTMCLL